MSGLLEVLVSDRGRTAPWSRHGSVLRLCFCTVWYCVELCGAVWSCVELCGAVCSNCVWYVYAPMVEHARALAGPVSG